MGLYSGITCRPIWMSLKRKIQPRLVSLALTPLKSCSNASISLSFTISNLDMRGLPISPQSTWLNPNVKELAKAQTLYPACGLLIGSPEALAISHRKGSITILWLVILTPVTSSDGLYQRRAWVASHCPIFALSCVKKKKKKRRKASRSCREDFKELSSELSGSFVKHLFHSNTHFLQRQLAGGGEHREILGILIGCQWIVDCWCSGSFVRMHLYRPEYEGCSCGSSDIRSSKHKKNKECCSSTDQSATIKHSFWQRQAEEQAGERFISAEICLMTKTCSMEIRPGELCFYGSCVLQSTVREAGISNSQQGWKMLPVWFHRGRET